MENNGKLIQFGVFWHDDTPDGWHITVSGNVQKAFDLVEESYRGFRSMPESERQRFLTEPEGVYAQLASVKPVVDKLQAGETLTGEEYAQALVCGVANVYLLLQEGLLANDEHNGMLFAYGVQ